MNKKIKLLSAGIFFILILTLFFSNKYLKEYKKEKKDLNCSWEKMIFINNNISEDNSYTRIFYRRPRECLDE